MWLLSTDRAELHFFPAPEDVKDGYAILSHVWDHAEQSFKDLRKLEKRCAASDGRETLRDLVGDKIRRCCELAEQHGYRWVWIDTCCIDKSSSAELSEAINSMYRYYSLSSICYAYLGDVPPESSFNNLLSETQRQPPDKFAQSRWHTRGWTLQELIAAPLVVFLGQGWEVLGSKAGFAAALQACTGIPKSLLQHERVLDDFSVAQRMSWAARRATTRVEDEAYCLLGIFNIQMPTLYGEGRSAFQRLQEEIMKRSEDTTLFAWGGSNYIESLSLVGRSGWSYTTASCLFAHSPAAFAQPHCCGYAHCAGIIFDTRGSLSSCGSPSSSTTDHATTLTVTPRGVLAHIPLLETDFATLANLSWACSHNRIRLFLLLSPRPVREDGYPSYSIYNDGDAFDRARRRKAMLAETGPCDSKWRWADVYLLHQPSDTASRARLSLLPMNVLLSPAQQFHFPSRTIQAFVDALNGTARRHRPQFSDYALTRTTNAGLADHDVPTAFVFSSPDSHFSAVVIQVGRCRTSVEDARDLLPHIPHIPQSARRQIRPLWARVGLVSHVLPLATLHPDGHDCATDHVSEWPDQTKDFSFLRVASIWALAVRLSFVSFPLDPNGATLHASAEWKLA